MRTPTALLTVAALAFAASSFAQVSPTGTQQPASSPGASQPATPRSSQAGSRRFGPGRFQTGFEAGCEGLTDKAAFSTTVAKSDAIPSPGEALDPHIKKGSEDDVDAVGTRNIGGRGLGNW